jgi:hypothetical protein
VVKRVCPNVKLLVSLSLLAFLLRNVKRGEHESGREEIKNHFTTIVLLSCGREEQAHLHKPHNVLMKVFMSSHSCHIVTLFRAAAAAAAMVMVMCVRRRKMCEDPLGYFSIIFFARSLYLQLLTLP